MPHNPHGKKPNRLAKETSPYLQQHAYNPVDWYPWGEAAFARARSEKKPIFLSIGYSTCHWCHVMERESFEIDAIAAVMNQYFVNIKVDREERPDIDKIYMTAVQASTGQGGWPMSVWLTPELKPFYCGTYFPPDARYGRPGFKQLLERIHDVWETNRDGVLNQAEQITESLKQHAAAKPTESGDQPIPRESLDSGFRQFAGSFDETHGGFGGAPKFPRPVIFNFLFRYARRSDVAPEHAALAQEMALKTLRAMGEGGMFDQLGGGFHRYSVDERWLVSHFEKMLYDQGQLVVSYSEAFQITRNSFFADIARRTCDYVLRDMTDPTGGLYSAEDADSEGVEGKFYVWQRREIEDVLGEGEATEVFCRYYGVTEDGNWEEGNNVLHVTLSIAQAAKLFHRSEPEVETILADGRQKLFAVREKRIRPHRDDKILTSWNGLMISGLAKAAQALDEPRYLEAATRAARHIVKAHYRKGELFRTQTIPAVLEDYAFFIAALIDLYETSFDPDWLVRAVELADTMRQRFEDAEHGGFFMTAGTDASVIIRPKEDYDGAEPSGNSVAALALLKLAQYADRDEYRKSAQRTLSSFRDHLTRAPHAVPQMLCALDFSLGKQKQIVIAGKPEAADTRAMVRALHERYLPDAIVMQVDDADRRQALAKLNPFVDSIKMLAAKATAYVCENFTCQAPTTEVGELEKAIDASTLRT